MYVYRGARQGNLEGGIQGAPTAPGAGETLTEGARKLRGMHRIDIMHIRMASRL